MTEPSKVVVFAPRPRIERNGAVYILESTVEAWERRAADIERGRALAIIETIAAELSDAPDTLKAKLALSNAYERIKGR